MIVCLSVITYYSYIFNASHIRLQCNVMLNGTKINENECSVFLTEVIHYTSMYVYCIDTFLLSFVLWKVLLLFHSSFSIALGIDVAHFIVIGDTNNKYIHRLNYEK